MNDKLLAIGTIVKLKRLEAFRMMILGYYPIDEDTQQMYEYLAVIYPQGILNDESLFLIHSSDIEEIIFQGYSDEESELLREIIPATLQQIALEEDV